MRTTETPVRPPVVTFDRLTGARQGRRVGSAMAGVIAERLAGIRQAHANNLLEGQDMGAEVLAGMLERAREPISNEEFTRRELARWQQQYPVRE